MVLEGVRVIDWTIWMAGPYASALLGDLGADVIHVERPGSGDDQRSTESFRGEPVGLPDGRNANFEIFNRNKRSLTIDLTLPGGREVMYDLISRADVFVSNHREAAAQKLGLDFDTLSGLNPKLIYVQASAFGTKGPDAHLGAVDVIGQARSGVMMSSGQTGEGPVQVTTGLTDSALALSMAYGTLAALIARDRYGVGQKVETSHLQATLNLQLFPLSLPLLTGGQLPREDRAGASNPLYNLYECSDGKWIALAMMQPERYWTAFCEALEAPQLLRDTRFGTFAGQKQHHRELVKKLSAVFGTRTSAAWSERLNRADVVCTVVQDLTEVLNDPQVRANGYITEFAHPALGPKSYLNGPVSLSATPTAIRTPAPQLGEHTEEILTGVLGYDWEHIGALRRKGIL